MYRLELGPEDVSLLERYSFSFTLYVYRLRKVAPKPAPNTCISLTEKWVAAW